MKIREIECKSALGKCGFPGGGLAINPYVGCGHGCVYCYARFIKRFTGHSEDWGTFVDARVNVSEVLQKQIKSPKFRRQRIYIGTVTDPYQPLEEKYQLTRKILSVLTESDNPVSILTKSDLVLRDIDLLKKLKEVDINFTINTLDEKWKALIEPNSPSVRNRLKAAQKLSQEGIAVFTMMGPYWPTFTEPEKLFAEFKKAGIKRVFSESFNTVGGNWTGVERVLTKHYPQFLSKIKEILFNQKEFNTFYGEAKNKIEKLSKEYSLPTTIYFGLGHAGKSKLLLLTLLLLALRPV
ncbi:MAG TPA: radical SAM protein [Patescibacteria group bacterium]|nr:radical SAM protein [Patescibacteria group bacterium]